MTQIDVTKDILVDLYENKTISARGIAEIYNTNHKNILRLLNKFSITRRKNVYSGKNHYNWKGGTRSHGKGYSMIYAPDHPRANKRTKVVMEHVLVMEQHIGRLLQHGEVVHHINEIKNDNRIENLVLLTDSEHKSLHAKNNSDTLRMLAKEQKQTKDAKTGRFIKSCR